jgi:hypothetical protein
VYNLPLPQRGHLQARPRIALCKTVGLCWGSPVDSFMIKQTITERAGDVFHNVFYKRNAGGDLNDE